MIDGSDNVVAQASQAAHDEFMSRMNELVDADNAESKKDAAGDDVPKDSSEGKAPEDADTTAQKTSDDESSGTQEEEAAGEESPKADDALLQRAVKAGMDLADARDLKPDVLERVVGKMEAKSEAKPAKESQGEPEAPKEDERLAKLDLDALKGEDGEFEFDEKLVGAFKASKEMITELRKELADLKAGVQKAQESPAVSWVDAKIESLGKEHEKLFSDAGKKAKLERYIEFVRSDAESDGTKLGNSEAFEKAMALGFSDFQSELKGKAAAHKSKERSAKAQNQPRGMNGKFGSDESRHMSDREREDDALKTLAGFFKDV